MAVANARTKALSSRAITGTRCAQKRQRFAARFLEVEKYKEVGLTGREAVVVVVVVVVVVLFIKKGAFRTFL